MNKEISIDTFNSITENNCLLITGNGFCINFDESFRNLYLQLRQAKKYVNKYSYFETHSNFQFNLEITANYLKAKNIFSNKPIEYFFEVIKNAIKLGNQVINDKTLINSLIAEKRVSSDSPHRLLNVLTAAKFGNISCVNFEELTCFIDLYFALKHYAYKFDTKNLFVQIMDKLDNSSGIFRKQETVDNSSVVVTNGFYLYYKMLFCSAIFLCTKKHINQYQNATRLNLNNITSFINRFSARATLNYDNMVEQLTNRECYHLHGKFVTTAKEDFYYISSGLNYNDMTVSFSDILIGGTYVKNFCSVMNKMSGNKKTSNGGTNKSADFQYDLMAKILEKYFIKSVVLFGINIQNDETLLRNILLGFEATKVKCAKIVYCFFNEDEINKFISTFNDCISYSNEINDYIRNNIEILMINTRMILHNYFY